jgi:multiple antibiotic resistance protein
MLPDALKPYLATFIPIFFAVDIIGTIPIYLSLTEELNDKQRSKIVTDSVIIAGLIAIAFIFVGKAILKSLGVGISDFKVAGGILIFILSVYLLLPNKTRDFVNPSLPEDIGIFPLATPLITGPAVLVTTIMLLDKFDLITTLTSLLLNMGLAWVMLKSSQSLIRLFGRFGIKALSKITYIFLAAIGMMMLREGIAGMIASF